jgi:hypothetical protein
MTMADGHIMHRLIAGSELHVYRGGHLDPMTEPHRLTPVIEQFLRAGDPPTEIRGGLARGRSGHDGDRPPTGPDQPHGQRADQPVARLRRRADHHGVRADLVGDPA